jgi:hypothetical protein
MLLILENIENVFMKSLCFALAIAISGVVFAQDTFATASVRPATSGADGIYCRGGPDTANPENFKCRDASLMLFNCLAYQVQYYHRPRATNERSTACHGTAA